MLNVAAATVSIKQAGPQSVRITPMSGHSISDGDYQIEIKTKDEWSPIMIGIKKPIAEQIVTQALNRTILG